MPCTRATCRATPPRTAACGCRSISRGSSTIVSRADGEAYVFRKGIEIGRAPVGGLRGFHGSYVYSALANLDAEGRHDWFATGIVGRDAPNIKELVKQTTVDPQFLANARGLIVPGTTLVLTDAPVNVSTHSGPGFSVLTTAAAR